MAYTLKGAKSGTVKFEPMKSGVVEVESESFESSVTTNAIESGSDINDHVNNENEKFSISGVVTGTSSISALKKMRDSRDIITYTGKIKVNNLVFTSLKFDYSYDNRDGAAFSATFQKIQRVTKKKVTKKSKMTDQDANKKKKKKKQTSKTKKSGKKNTAQQYASAAAVLKHVSAYKFLSSIAPLTRITGGYDGLK